MFTRITGHLSAVVATVVVLTGGAVLRGAAATADPNQDDLFKALLNQEDIPALEGVPSLISTAHKICLVLDRGIPARTVVSTMVNHAYAKDPAERSYPPARLESTMVRFITASVEAYCPNDQSKITSIVAHPAPASYEPTRATAGYVPAAAYEPGQPPTSVGVVGRRATAPVSLIGPLPSGDMTPPSPPPIPPPPPADHLRTPPKLIAAPRVPKRLTPPPQQAPSPPQQVKPPAVRPVPGAPAGGNGGGSTSGGGPVAPAPAPPPPPAPPMGPGFVRLAP